MPVVELDEDAKKLLVNYRWPGNVRQLKNITEQISIIEENRLIPSDILIKYLPQSQNRDLPVLYSKKEVSGKEFLERELLYKVLFDMRQDVNDLKKLVSDIIQNEGDSRHFQENHSQQIQNLYKNFAPDSDDAEKFEIHQDFSSSDDEPIQHSEILEESLSLQKKEVDLIKKALEKHNGKRKNAAKELGISERTLYRKIKEYDIQ